MSLDSFDEVLKRLIASLPLRLVIATTEEQREAVYRLRYRAIVDAGWGRPEDFPDGVERDAFDDLAVHIMALDERGVAGVARLVFPVAGKLLPTEEICGKEIPPPGLVADLGRLAIAPDRRGGERQVFVGLLSRVAQEVRACGYLYFAGMVSPAMRRLYRLVGVRLDYMGPAQVHWGEERRPVRYDIMRSGPAFITRFRYLLDEPNDGERAGD